MTPEPEWLGLLRAHNWGALTGRMLSYPKAEQAALLDALRQMVPTTTEVNGTETQKRHKHPAELGHDPRAGAAKILLLGELEASVRGVPEDAGQTWQKLQHDVGRLMEDLVAAPEVTRGDASLSRRKHALDALAFLDEIERNSQAMILQLDDAEDRRWLSEGLADLAALALRAGAAAQAAHGKVIESDAVRGAKVVTAARQGAEKTRQNNSAINMERLKRMGELRDSGHTKARAAEIAHREGLGVSADANRKLWQRSRKK